MIDCPDNLESGNHIPQYSYQESYEGTGETIDIFSIDCLKCGLHLGIEEIPKKT